jgi:hypothetical protein
MIQMKNKKKETLLAAAIFGVLMLLIIFLIPLILKSDGDDSVAIGLSWCAIPDMASGISIMNFVNSPFENFVLEIVGLIFLVLIIIFLAIFPIVSIIAVVLNCIGWNNNSKKITLASAVLYILGLNIISAALCFIGYAELKKKYGGKAGL